MQKRDLSNQTHGTFLVIARDTTRTRYWRAVCTLCKVESHKRQDELIELTARCRCNDARIVHGDAGRANRDPLHILWQNVRQRVRKQPYSYPLELHPGWQARGKGYRAFRDYILTHLGRRPSERHSLDRINVMHGYVPGNIRWATASEQANNRTSNRLIESAEYRAALTSAEWAQYLGAVTGDPARWTRKRLQGLLDLGLTIEQIVSAVHPQRRTPQELADARQRVFQTETQREAEEAFAEWTADF